MHRARSNGPPTFEPAIKAESLRVVEKGDHRASLLRNPALTAPGTDALDALDAALKATLPMARIEVRALPGCESIRLGLINGDFPLGPLPHDVMLAVLARPAYWAFCWGSGLALARHLIARPELVRGRSVLDFGSGSGVVAIAAKRAGAARVIACDNDPHARIAIAANARLNTVDLEIVDALTATPGRHDLALLADVLYDRENLALLDAVIGRADETLVADSRLTSLSRDDFELIGEVAARTFPNLGEFDQYATVRLFRHR